MIDPTKIMHLPSGAAPPRPAVPRRSRWPFLNTIITLCIVDGLLLIATAYVYLTHWEDIFRG